MSSIRPIHLNWSCLKEEDWDRVRRQLGTCFKKEPYGNFMDVFGEEGIVLSKIRAILPAATLEVHRNWHSGYQAWIQIKA